MTYQLSFFCRSGEQTGQAALVKLWSAVAWDGMSGFAVAEGRPEA